MSTDAHFIIRNCTLMEAGGFTGAGVRLENVINGKIINNTVATSQIKCGQR